jgi:hypothetical protein
VPGLAKKQIHLPPVILRAQEDVAADALAFALQLPSGMIKSVASSSSTSCVPFSTVLPRPLDYFVKIKMAE